jgi:branched-chain amino acid transport system substrate-binding protein
VTIFGQSGKRAGRAIGAGLVLGFGLALASCAPGEFSIGSRTISFAGPSEPVQAAAPAMPPAMPMQMGTGESFGRGPVRVALLLPLSGDPGLNMVGISLANAAKLAIGFIEANPNIAENITISLKDTGPSAGGAAQAASQAVAEGASLILGPLKADQVIAAGAVARSAGIPLIGFSNNSSAASPGVYLLNVLPEAEIKRSLTFASNRGRTRFAGIFPMTEFGRVQEAAFRQTAASLGIAPAAIYTFSNEAEARTVVAQAAALIQSGQIDALFLPDRGTAPSLGTMLQQEGISGASVTLIGSADWEGDPTIRQTAALGGALYPAVDEAGLLAISGEYQARFGAPPHPLATIAYTATILANVNTLSMANPRYDTVLLTAATGFNGRDGVFRFLGNGRSEYGLVIKQIGAGNAVQVDGPRL